jgi:fumarate hydratase subunit alpha/L(+)-tartrate dehydratase alpha subunit
MIQNIAVAESTDNLTCQDTGVPIYNVTIGRDVRVDGVDLTAAIVRGCARATVEHPFRSSVVHPLTRGERTTRPAASESRSSTWHSPIVRRS